MQPPDTKHLAHGVTTRQNLRGELAAWMSVKVNIPPGNVLFVSTDREDTARFVEARMRYAAPRGPVAPVLSCRAQGGRVQSVAT
jgi:hypothetical protein